jgi:hypothetical protein
MATYKDWEMLQGSMQGLTDTVLRKRALDETAKDRETQRLLQERAIERQLLEDKMNQDWRKQTAADQNAWRNKEASDTADWRLQQAADAERRAAEASRQHEAEMGLRQQEIDDRKTERDTVRQMQEELRGNADAMRQVGAINDAVNKIRLGVADGSISPENGNAQAKAIHQQLKRATKAIVGFTPLSVFDEDPEANMFRAPKKQDEGVEFTVDNEGKKTVRYKMSKADFEKQQAAAQAESQKAELAGLNQELVMLKPGSPEVYRNLAKQRVIEAALKGGVTPSPGGAVTSPPAAPTAADEGEVFDTEEAARAAGFQAGDVVRLNLNGKPTRVRLK